MKTIEMIRLDDDKIPYLSPLDHEFIRKLEKWIREEDALGKRKLHYHYEYNINTINMNSILIVLNKAEYQSNIVELKSDSNCKTLVINWS